MLAWVWGRPSHLVSTRFAVAMLIMASVAGAVGADLGRTLTAPTVVRVREVHSFDLANPWERCLDAMEAAEIPGDMWECYEYPRERP